MVHSELVVLLVFQIFIKAKPKGTSQKATVNEKAIYALDSFFATEPAGKVTTFFLSFFSVQ
jgi:hypothetical protein